MKCIYCLNETDAGAGLAHVLPEALAQNDLVLERGTVCDPCNQYLGQLDSVLASHPLVALGIQWLRLPGKNGKVRSIVGNVEQAEGIDAVHIPVAAPSIEDRGGGRQASATVLVPRTFDGFKFRRSLYHVALNLVAHSRGTDVVLGPEFDEVRRYVRSPRKNERWPFGQMPLFESISPEVKLVVQGGESDLFVGLRLFAAIFWVDLQNNGRLEAFLKSQKDAPGLRFVGPSDRLPREGPKPGEKRYRLTIYRNE